jgi:uncharacterized RDD family membrane protein YckC
MKERGNPIEVQLNIHFYLHLLITLFAWVGPFLIDWWLMCSIYVIVLLQFLFLNRCVVNAGHNLEEGEGITFYAFLLEKMNIYFLLGVMTWAIQTYGGYIPPFSFGSTPF